MLSVYSKTKVFTACGSLIYCLAVAVPAWIHYFPAITKPENDQISILTSVFMIVSYTYIAILPIVTRQIFEKFIKIDQLVQQLPRPSNIAFMIAPSIIMMATVIPVLIVMFMAYGISAL